MEQQKVYGYARVSSYDQNEARQLQALDDYGITKDRIFVDKVSGKDFNGQEYQTLKRMLKDSPHSLLVITSIDRLGRNYKEITKEWQMLTTESLADIKVLDTTQYKDLLGTFISDLILQVLSFIAEQERRNIRTRQAEGIAIAKSKNIKFGRPPIKVPDNFGDVCTRWNNGEITATEAMNLTGLKRTNFYKMVNNLNIRCK